VYKILVEPTPVPVTVPVAEPTEPIPGFMLLHMPPDIGSLNVVDEPSQIEYVV